MILVRATGVVSTDPLLAASRYGGNIGTVVLGEEGTGWLWEGEGRIFELLEEMNRS